MDNLQKALLAVVMLVLSGAYAFSATGGVYLFPGGDKVTLAVTVSSPTMGEYATSWSDGTGSSGSTTATPSGTKPGDVETSPAQTTSGKGSGGKSVKGGTYRVHKGKAQQKDSKGRWRTGKLLPKKKDEEKKESSESGPRTMAGGAGTSGTLPLSRGPAEPGQSVAGRERVGALSRG